MYLMIVLLFSEKCFFACHKCEISVITKRKRIGLRKFIQIIQEVGIVKYVTVRVLGEKTKCRFEFV